MMLDDDTTDARAGIRRAADAEQLGEMRLLRHEFETLKDRIKQDEISFGGRIAALEGEATQLKARISGGKGLLLGVLVASGGLGLLVVDNLKAFLGLAK